MSRCPGCLMVLVGAVGVAGGALGSEPPPGAKPASATTTAGGQQLQRVEQMHADIGPLRTSTRELRPDLRVPLNFDEVYRVPGAGGVGAAGVGPDRFARVSGGLSAVFPRSQYQPTKEQGMEVMVPPGTVFYIGAAPTEVQGAGAPRAAARATGQVDLSVDPQRVSAMVRALGPAEGAPEESAAGSSRIIPAAAALGAETPRTEAAAGGEVRNGDGARAQPKPLGVMTSEAFRRARVSELIRQAATVAAVNPGARTPEPERREAAAEGNRE